MSTLWKFLTRGGPKCGTCRWYARWSIVTPPGCLLYGQGYSCNSCLPFRIASIGSLNPSGVVQVKKL